MFLANKHQFQAHISLDSFLVYFCMTFYKVWTLNDYIEKIIFMFYKKASLTEGSGNISSIKE